jgi:hypothetical protein
MLNCAFFTGANDITEDPALHHHLSCLLVHQDLGFLERIVERGDLLNRLDFYIDRKTIGTVGVMYKREGE